MTDDGKGFSPSSVLFVHLLFLSSTFCFITLSLSLFLINLYLPSPPLPSHLLPHPGILCGTCRPDLGVGVLSTHCYPPVQYGYLIFIPLSMCIYVDHTFVVAQWAPTTLRAIKWSHTYGIVMTHGCVSVCVVCVCVCGVWPQFE